jgi:hypothetical protein
MQTRKDFVVPRPAVIEPPPSPCTQCGIRMWLVRIAPTPYGYELRTFECSKGHVDRYAVVYGSSLPWVLISE